MDTNTCKSAETFRRQFIITITSEAGSESSFLDSSNNPKNSPETLSIPLRSRYRSHQEFARKKCKVAAQIAKFLSENRLNSESNSISKLKPSIEGTSDEKIIDTLVKDAKKKSKKSECGNCSKICKIF